jgi:hypothetical protein
MAKRSRICLALTGAVGALSLLPAAASATPDVPAACEAPATQAFLAFGDTSLYQLAAGGDAESVEGWDFSAGSGAVAGNEPFDAAGAGTQSIALTARGATATMPTTCIGRVSVYPHMRFFARNTGDAGSKLRVEAIYTNKGGVTSTKLLSKVRADAAWAPSSEISLKLPASFSEAGTALVRFRFTVEGSGSWQIDDVFVDPFIR